MKCISPPLHSGKAALKGPFEGGLALFFFCFFSPSCRVLGRENNNNLAAPCCLLPNSCCLSISRLPRRASPRRWTDPLSFSSARASLYKSPRHNTIRSSRESGIIAGPEHQQPHAVFLLHVFETMCTDTVKAKSRAGNDGVLQWRVLPN